MHLSDLHRYRWKVGVLSTRGVLASTAMVGFGLMWLTQLAGIDPPLIWYLPFDSEEPFRSKHKRSPVADDLNKGVDAL